MTSLFIGIDLGGTTTRVAVSAQGNRIISTSPTTAGDPDTLVDHIVASLSTATSRSNVRITDIDGVGIGLPGTVDDTTGSIRSATNLGLGSEFVPLRTILEDRLSVPITVENDVKTAALGLAQTLPGGGDGILTYVSVGTGVASASVIDGSILRGAHGSAGEIGQMQLDPRGPLLEGALPGSLEALAAGKAIADVGADLASATRHLARGVHALWMTLDPDLMVFGGGVTQIEGFEDHLIASIQEMRSASTVTASVIDPSRIRVLPPEALPGLDGALHLAQQVSGRATVPATTGGETV